MRSRERSPRFGVPREWLVGKEFNSLTVESIVADRRPDQPLLWLCRCRCGGARQVSTKSLKRGDIKTCGCDVFRYPEGMRTRASALYDSGLSIAQVAAQLGVPRDTAATILVRRKRPLRRMQEAVRMRGSGAANGVGYTLNDAAFDTITEHSAYWIGFLAADGYICEDAARPSVFLGLAERDLGHVEKFRAFLGTDRPIKVCRNRSTLRRRDGTPTKCSRLAYLRVNSSRLVAALVRHGVTQGKSWTVRAIGLADNPHYWRGFIDGDGCLFFNPRSPKATSRTGIAGDPGIILTVASRQLAEQFRGFVRSVSPGYGGGIYVRKPNEERKSEMYAVSVTCRHASHLAATLYAGASVYLDRKKALADRMTNEYRPFDDWREVSSDELLAAYRLHGNWKAVGKSLGMKPNVIHPVARRVLGPLYRQVTRPAG